MRFMVLLPVCIALAAPAQAQFGSGISGITSYLSNHPAQPINGYHPENFGYIGYGLADDLRKAQSFVAAGQYNRADPLLDKLIGRTPNKKVRFLKGVTKLGLGDAAAARRYFEQSLYRGRNGSPGAMSGLALAEIRLGNVDAANDILGRLRHQQQVCADNCDRAESLDQAIAVVEKALI